MRDIPIFTTPSGAASLTLNQIPYTNKAYIRIQSSVEPVALLEECIAFCRACGAQFVYASNISENQSLYPEYTKIVKMQADRNSIGDTDAALFPVTEKTLEKWRNVYNEKAAKLPNAAYMSRRDAENMLHNGDGYFVHRDSQLLGIGKASGDQLHWVASIVPNAGADVIRALCHALSSDQVCLEVASVNYKAINLYENLGFLQVGIQSVWYQVF